MDPDGPLVSHLPNTLLLNSGTNPPSILYLVILILLIVAAFLSSCETTYAFANKYRLKVFADKGNRGAKMALSVLSHFDAFVSTISVLINVVQISTSVIASLLAINAFGEAIGSILSTVIVTLLIFVFGDTIPKNVAKANADAFAMAYSFPVRALMVVLTPITFIFRCLAKLALKLTKQSGTDENQISEDDLSDIIESVENEGVIDPDESDIIQAAIDFGDTIVKDVLTPANKMVAVNINITQKELTDLLISGTYSRYPVYEGNIDNIVGVLHLRSYMRELAKNKGKTFNLRELLKKPVVVQQSANLQTIFEAFKKNKTHIAIVKDVLNEHTVGLVTMEDVLEELIGNEVDTEAEVKTNA
ncbi:MAG: hemolysin family protein [Clostridia bacterium]|nr:hemolysin family protein [Clostridia bacterium]